MKKIIQFAFLGALFILISGFAIHKFYAAIYQVNFVPEKKMIQITARLFSDDVDKALEKKYHVKTTLTSDKPTTTDMALLKKYSNENFVIKVNGQTKPMNLLSSELEGDVIICYFSIKEISKINTLAIQNSILVDWNAEQQNIMHFTINGTKKSLLFSDSNRSEMLKY